MTPNSWDLAEAFSFAVAYELSLSAFLFIFVSSAFSQLLIHLFFFVSSVALVVMPIQMFHFTRLPWPSSKPSTLHFSLRGR